MQVQVLALLPVFQRIKCLVFEESPQNSVITSASSVQMKKTKSTYQKVGFFNGNNVCG
jgi:hypothetical protein